MNECNQEKLEKDCGCTYMSCSRRGKCCECIQYHVEKYQLPGCIFAKVSKTAEESYDRSFDHFARLILERN